MAVFSGTVMTAIAAKKTAMETMHGEIQGVLKGNDSAKQMVAWQKLRELDELLSAAILAAEAVELHNEDLLESRVPIP